MYIDNNNNNNNNNIFWVNSESVAASLAYWNPERAAMRCDATRPVCHVLIRCLSRRLLLLLVILGLRDFTLRALAVAVPYTKQYRHRKTKRNKTEDYKNVLTISQPGHSWNWTGAATAAAAVDELESAPIDQRRGQRAWLPTEFVAISLKSNCRRPTN